MRRKAVDPVRERELALLRDTEDIVTQARLDKIERQSKSIGALLGQSQSDTITDDRSIVHQMSFVCVFIAPFTITIREY